MEPAGARISDLGGYLRPDDAIAPQIGRALWQAIVTLQLQPGAIVSETEIARRYGVSRQPVREAFIKLVELGLMQVLPQRGSRILRISVARVRNAQFVREAVEVEVVRELAKTGAGRTVAPLDTLLEEQRAAADRGDSAAFLALDEAFHRVLAAAVGREFVWDLLEPVKVHMDRVRFLSFAGFTPTYAILAQHRAILDAVTSGDASGAEAAIRIHLREILASLPRIREAQPDYFEPEPAHDARDGM